MRVMTPLLGTNISSTPVGDVPAGDNKTARAKAAKVFTRHEPRPLPGARRKPARIPRFSRNTNHESRLFFESRILPPPSHSFPVHDCSPLFTIVHHCSRLFGIVHQKILPWASVASPSVPATRPVWFSRNTRHGTRITAFVVGRLWRGMGGGRPPHRQHRL